MASTEKNTQVSDSSNNSDIEGNKYELMFIVVPDLSKEDTDKQLNKVRKYIKDLKGEIYHEDDWGIRNLAYIIKKYDTGYYVIFYFTSSPENIKELDKELLLDAKILRHLIVKSPKNYTIKKLSELELTEEDKEKMKAVRKAKAAASKSKFEKTEIEKTEKKAKDEVKDDKTKAADMKDKETTESKKTSNEGQKKQEKEPMDIADLDSKLEDILNDPDMDIKL
jgi:small subunit ribosomal protein S6